MRALKVSSTLPASQGSHVDRCHFMRAAASGGDAIHGHSRRTIAATRVSATEISSIEVRGT